MDAVPRRQSVRKGQAMNNFSKAAEDCGAYILEQRRWLHRHAELSWQERETTEHIAGELRAMGLEPHRFPDGRTGVWATIHGHNAGERGRTILLRADIDALPVQECTGAEYASIHSGVMHACGHDCHGAMLLGAAKLLTQCADQLSGDVRLLFQGGEETAIGAKYYVEQGILDGVDAVYSCHVNSDYPAGTINLQTGSRMPSCDQFAITVQGVSAHGAMPHRGKDPIVAAANIIMSLQTLVSRVNDPQNALVVSVGKIEGGQSYNIIPGSVELQGTVRTFSRRMREEMDQLMRQIAQPAAQAMGCTAELDYQWKTGPVIHDSALMNRLVRQAAVELYGEAWINEEVFGVFSDDFAFFSERVPGFYAMLGIRNESLDCVYPHHHQCFNVDESVLPRGAAMFAQVAADFLHEAAL